MTPVSSSEGIHRIDLEPTVKSVLPRSVLLAVLGCLEVVVPFLLVWSRLPSSVPDHYGLNSAPNAFASPLTVLGLNLALTAGVSVVFFLVLWGSERSVPLKTQFRGRLSGALLLIQGALVLIGFPLISGIMFASAAGLFSLTGTGLGVLFLVIGLSIPAVILGAALLDARRRTRTVPTSHGSPTPIKARWAVGGPIELACSSCGKHFVLSGVPVLAPHMGIGQFGSLYLRCPLCGERGWDAVIGRVSEPELTNLVAIGD